jgi:hypothetical protein
MENKCTFRAIISGLPVFCKFASCVHHAPDWALRLMLTILAVNRLALHCVPEHVTDWNRQNGWTRIKVKNIRADPSHPCRSVFYSSFQDEARLRGLARAVAHRGRFFGKPLRAISRFSHQDAQPPPSPLVGEGGGGMRGKGAQECRTSLISPKNSTLERRAVGVNPSAIQGKARLRGLFPTNLHPR